MTQQPIRQHVELELIRGDAFLYKHLMVHLPTKQSAAILLPSLVPYFSLFAVESCNYLQRSYPAFTDTLSEEMYPIISSSRMRVKFFDDTKKEVEGTLEILDWIKGLHQEWHIRRHKGLLAPIKRLLQDDLGLYFYNGHMVGSTHTAIMNIGYSKADLPNRSDAMSDRLGHLSLSLGAALSSYIAGVISFLETKTQDRVADYYNYRITDRELKYKDEKSERLLKHIFNGAGTGPINLVLLLFLTHVNFLLYIFDKLIIEQQYTMFKLKYIVLYHLGSSLEKLRAYNQSSHVLTERSNNYLDSIISDAQFIDLTSQRRFRNTLVHYGIPPDLDNHLSLDTTLFGLTEYFFAGRSYETICASVQSQIERVSTLLEEWLSWEIRPEALRNW
jgi:hypothetical protein